MGLLISGCRCRCDGLGNPVAVRRPVKPIGDGATYNRTGLADDEVEISQSWVASTTGGASIDSWHNLTTGGFSSHPLACASAIVWNNWSLQQSNKFKRTIGGFPPPDITGPDQATPNTYTDLDAIHLSTALRIVIADHVEMGFWPSYQTRVIPSVQTVFSASHLADCEATQITVNLPIHKVGNNGAGNVICTHAQARIDGVAVGEPVAQVLSEVETLVHQAPAELVDSSAWDPGGIFPRNLAYDPGQGVTVPISALSNSLIEVDLWMSIINLADNASYAQEKVETIQSWMIREDVYPVTAFFPRRGSGSIEWTALNSLPNTAWAVTTTHSIFGETVFNKHGPAGWDREVTPTGAKWSITDDPAEVDYSVEFNHSREIPYVQIDEPVSGGATRNQKRWHPPDTGDFHTTSDSGSWLPPGLWDPDVSTVFVYGADNDTNFSLERWSHDAVNVDTATVVSD